VEAQNFTDGVAAFFHAVQTAFILAREVAIVFKISFDRFSALVRGMQLHELKARVTEKRVEHADDDEFMLGLIVAFLAQFPSQVDKEPG